MVGRIVINVEPSLRHQLELQYAHGHSIPVGVGICHELHLLLLSKTRPGAHFGIKVSDFNDPLVKLSKFRGHFNPARGAGTTPLSVAVSKASSVKVLISYDAGAARYVWTMSFFADEAQEAPIATAIIKLRANGELTDFEKIFNNETSCD